MLNKSIIGCSLVGITTSTQKFGHINLYDISTVFLSLANLKNRIDIWGWGVGGGQFSGLFEM